MRLLSRILEMLRSILHPVEYEGPLHIRVSFRARYAVVDEKGTVVIETYDERWAKECVQWYNGGIQ